MQETGSICHIIPHTKAWSANVWIQGSQKSCLIFLVLRTTQKCIKDKLSKLGHGSTHHGIVLEATKFTIGATQFISFTCDEDNYINNQN